VGRPSAGFGRRTARDGRRYAGRGSDCPYNFAVIEARLMLPFRHSQASCSHALADGAAAGFMLNWLNA